MDVERLEQHVFRCPLQELEFRNEAGVYVLGNVHTKPAWWFVRHEPTGLSSQNLYKDRGLKNVINMMKQLYPDFYAWLAFTFPEDEKSQA